MTNLMLILAFVFAGTVFAESKQDPRFTWEMAKREYANGTLPAATAVVGEWTYVGAAEKGSSQYYPDGKYLSGGTLTKYFARVVELESFPPGTARFKLENVAKDLDADKETAPSTYKASANKTGLRYLFSKMSKNGDITDCEVEVECRMAQTPDSFVCGFYVTGDKGCVRVYGKEPYKYWMYIR